MVTRPFEMLVSPTLTGPYTIQGGSVLPKTVPSSLEDPEDPVIWCSGGQYHMVYNYWESRKNACISRRSTASMTGRIMGWRTIRRPMSFATPMEP
jgi:hypothetical protein